MSSTNLCLILFHLVLTAFFTEGAVNPYTMTSTARGNVIQLQTDGYPYRYFTIGATDLDVTCYIDSDNGVDVDMVRLQTDQDNIACPYYLSIGPQTNLVETICSDEQLEDYSDSAKRVFLYFQRDPTIDYDIGVKFSIAVSGRNLKIGCIEEYITPTEGIVVTTPIPPFEETEGLTYIVVIVVLVIFVAFIIALILSVVCKKRREKESAKKEGETGARSNDYRKPKMVTTITPSPIYYNSDTYQKPHPAQPSAVVYQDMNDHDNSSVIIRNGLYSSTIQTAGYNNSANPQNVYGNPQNVYATSLKSQKQIPARVEYVY